MEMISFVRRPLAKFAPRAVTQREPTKASRAPMIAHGIAATSAVMEPRHESNQPSRAITVSTPGMPMTAPTTCPATSPVVLRGNSTSRDGSSVESALEETSGTSHQPTSSSEPTRTDAMTTVSRASRPRASNAVSAIPTMNRA